MFNIGNRGKWLRNPVDIKEANKQAKIYIGRSLTLHSHLFCYAHRLCMTYIIAMLLSVSCMSTHNHLQNRTIKNFVLCIWLTKNSKLISISSWKGNYVFVINTGDSNQFFFFFSEFIYLLHSFGLTYWYLYTAIRYRRRLETFCLQ